MMKKENDFDIKAIAEEILCYLTKKPESADTLDGVVQWWLIHERYLRGLNQVQRALDFLVEKGLVIERIGADSKKIYSAHDIQCDDNHKG